MLSMLLLSCCELELELYFHFNITQTVAFTLIRRANQGGSVVNCSINCLLTVTTSYIAVVTVAIL